MKKSKKKLKTLRSHIDLLDKKIVALLNERARESLSIGLYKKKDGKKTYSPDREQEVLKKIKNVNKGPLVQESLEAVYREIMSGSLSLNNDIKVSYLGPKATFTHQAAIKRFGSQVEFVPCESIKDVFSEVERDNCSYGVVPIENSTEGAVNHTLDMFVDSDLKICSQVQLGISHNLLSKTNLKNIKRIYSNPYVFAQCRRWLDSNLYKVEYIDVSSTTRAADIASRESKSACIASILAAKEYNLKVLAKDIEDSPHNYTRFLIVGNQSVPQTGADKTSILFSIKDRTGALHDMLVPFKKHKINLTKIESRPSKKKAWDYYFFVDFKGHLQEKKIRKALGELETSCKFLKVLGSYPEQIK
ncbi:MAG: prephenate dehydratase [Candidatus Gygaella obscura]|nr:prephenate dehydratase [Candidatus Gygaella obscura]